MKRIWLGTLVLFLSGCGFHLRGVDYLPVKLHALKIETHAPYSEFTQSLERRLRGLGVKPNANAYVLKVLSYGLTRDNTNTYNVSAVQTLNLNYHITYQLLDQRGTVLLPQRTVRETKLYNYNQNAFNAANLEISTLKTDLREKAISALITTLQAKSLKVMLAKRVANERK